MLRWPRFARGHREAFPVVFQLLWPSLRNFSIKLLGSESDAEDVAQVALLKVFSRITEYDIERDALSWAFGIASYEVKTVWLRRRRRKETADEALATTADGAATAVDLVQDSQIRARLAERGASNA